MPSRTKSENDLSKLQRLKTQEGQISHVNLRDHDRPFSIAFLASIVLVILYAFSQTNSVSFANVLHSKSEAHHVVFVLDVSYSMKGQPLRDTSDAVSKFIDERKVKSPNDVISVVTFSADGEVKFAKHEVTNVPSLDLKPQSSTYYSKGLREALSVFKRVPDTFTPQLVSYPFVLSTDGIN